MNDNNGRSDELQRAWTWVGIGIAVLILLVVVNGPIFINRLISGLPTPQFQDDSVFFVDPPQEEAVQVEAEPTIEEIYYEPELIDNFVLENLSGYDSDFEWQQGSSELYLTATFSEERNVYWYWGWCASDQTTLEENFSQMGIYISLNNESVESFLSASYNITDEYYCQGFDLSGLDWIPGNYVLRIEYVLKTDINNGLSATIYPAATHIVEYQITVTD